MYKNMSYFVFGSLEVKIMGNRLRPRFLSIRQYYRHIEFPPSILLKFERGFLKC